MKYADAGQIFTTGEIEDFAQRTLHKLEDGLLRPFQDRLKA